MVPKQAEMDDVVRLVYAGMESHSHLHNALLVLLGDHGTTEQGNHGGGTPGELAAAMAFVSPRLRSLGRGAPGAAGGRDSPIAPPPPPAAGYRYYSVVDQVDVVPTLAGLLGFSAPAESAGVFIPELLGLFGREEDRLRVAMQNARQLMRLLRATAAAASPTSNNTACTSSGDSAASTTGSKCPEGGAQVFSLWDKVVRLEKEWRSTSEDACLTALKQAIFDVSRLLCFFGSVSIYY